MTYCIFSWHEMGVFDLPAYIDYILERTARSQLHYIGHSQGTTTFFVMASTRPEYNQKIKSMHALAPVAYFEHNTNLLLKIVDFSEQLVVSFDFLLMLISSGHHVF